MAELQPFAKRCLTQDISTRIKNRHSLAIDVLVQIPAQPVGLLFIVHGWKSSKTTSSATVFANVATSQDYIAVRFDCTHSGGGSDGFITESTISSFISDLEDVVDWASTQPWFCTPYLLAGSSLGGITILEHARKYPHQVTAIAPVATVISGNLSIDARNRNDAKGLTQWQQSGWEEQDTAIGTALFPWSHMEDRLKYDATTYAPQLMTPVFMCVGELDLSCPPDQQKVLFDSLGSFIRELHIIKGAPHSLKEANHLMQLENHFSKWLLKVAGFKQKLIFRQT